MSIKGPNLPLSKRSKLVRQLEQKFDQQKALLAEAAGAYAHEGKPVPQELGEAFGAIDMRSRLFHQISKVLVESENPGLGAEKLIAKFLEDVIPHNATIARALEVMGRG